MASSVAEEQDGRHLEVDDVLRRPLEARTPEGKRRPGRPKVTWRRTIEAERKDLGWTSWNGVEREAQDRDGWHLLLRGLMLHSRRSEEGE